MPITLRAPSTLPSSTPSPTIHPPALQWLAGPWHVTHSTLPMWRKNRNVVITYTPIAGTAPPHLDDLVTYQPLASDKRKTVAGVDKPFDVGGAGADTAGAAEGEAAFASLGYNWRGKGLLAIATSKWEILAHGDEEGTQNAYVVTYFAKTLFTPAGVDFYSRKGKLKPETVEEIKGALTALGGEVAKLAGDVFEVAMDGTD